MKIAVGAIIIALVFGVIGTAQDKAPEVPTLTKEQNQGIDLLLQRLRIAELEIQKAQLDFEKTSKELTQTLTDLQRPGYTFDVEKRVYVKKPEPIKK